MRHEIHPKLGFIPIICKRGRWSHDTRVVDQKIKVIQMAVRPVGKVFHVLKARQVQLRKLYPAVRLRFSGTNAFNCFLPFVRIAAGDDDMHPLPIKCERGFISEPGICARDDGRFFHLIFHNLSLCWFIALPTVQRRRLHTPGSMRAYPPPTFQCAALGASKGP